MEKKKHLKRFLRIIAALLSVVLVIGGFGYILNNPDPESECIIKSFYEEPDNSLDYVIIGSSATSRGINPLEIWKESGLKGCNLSLGAVSSNIYCSVLNEVMAHQKDALIIVDVDGFTTGDDVIDLIQPRSYWLDLMPKNANWMQSVIELDKDNKVEHFLPIIKYHNKTLNFHIYLSQKFDNNTKSMKGFIIRNDEPIIEETGIMTLMKPVSQKEELDTNANAFFEDFIDLCKQYNIKNVLFVKTPKTTNDEKIDSYILNEKRTNYIKEIVEQNGYQLLDYVALDNPIELTVDDFLDTAHLKISGSIKYSRWLSNYLTDTYDFKIDTSNESQWQKDFDYLKNIYISNEKYVE